MWGNRELVLALVVVAALQCTLNSAKELDMAVDSVDDRYDGCRADVLKRLPDLLKAELAASTDFKKAWEAKSNCNAVVPGALPEHVRALLAYAGGGKAFVNKFNNAVATMGGNHSFPFYSLHFLLTDAMTLLSGKGGTCRTVYSISPQLYSAQKGAKVKLGGFMSASKDRSLLLEDPDVEGGVMFNITSCLAFNLEEIMCGKVETLLLPTEEFTVEDIHKVKNEDDYTYTSITLKHSGFSSKHNCYLTPRRQQSSSTQVVGCIWVVYLTVALFGLLN